jgi:hypothetical protein
MCHATGHGSKQFVILTLSVMKYCLQPISHSHCLWLVPRAGRSHFLYRLLLHSWLTIIKTSEITSSWEGNSCQALALTVPHSAKLLSDDDPVAVIAVTHSTSPLSYPTQRLSPRMWPPSPSPPTLRHRQRYQY